MAQIENPLSNLRLRSDMKNIIRLNFDDDACGMPFEFTICPNPSLTVWGFKEVRDRLERVLRKILWRCNTNPKIILLNETSDTGLWHYHGLLVDVPKSRLSLFRKALNSGIGRHEIKQISNMPAYMDYITKRYNELETFNEYLDIYINIKRDI